MHRSKAAVPSGRHAGWLSLAVMSVALGCGSSGDSKEVIDQAWTDCDEIASRCHVHWMESEAASKCHDMGHMPAGNDPKVCTARKTECLALCPIVPKMRDAGAGEGGQPAASDGGEDGPAGEPLEAGALPPDAQSVPPDVAPVDPEITRTCTTYCQCMQATCMSKLTEDPALAGPACLDTCTKYQPMERACWANFCQLASQGMSKGHSCDHAAGDFGLDECQ